MGRGAICGGGEDFCGAGRVAVSSAREPRTSEITRVVSMAGGGADDCRGGNVGRECGGWWLCGDDRGGVYGGREWGGCSGGGGWCSRGGGRELLGFNERLDLRLNGGVSFESGEVESQGETDGGNGGGDIGVCL